MKNTLRQGSVAVLVCVGLLLGLSGCKSTIPTLAPTLSVPTPTPALEEVEIIAWVNGEPISGEQFEKRVKYERLTLVQTFLNYQMSEYASLFQSQLLQLQYQLDDTTLFASDILDRMAWEMALVQKAKELGITVSEQEVDRDIEQNFGYYVNGTPTPAAMDAVKPTSTYSPTQLAMVTPPPVSQPTPTPLPTQLQPTPTTYTYDSFKLLYDTVIDNLENQTQFGDSDFRNNRSGVLYQQKLYELITKDVPSEQDMVWARHILVSTEAEATEILRRLKAGENFSALATLYSIDTGSASAGGDLEWFIKGQMVEDFETAAWALPIGELSQPVKTDFGYHIIQVLGHETRPLDADQLSIAKSNVYKEFIDQVQADADIKKLDTWKNFVATEPVIPANYKIIIQPTLAVTPQP